MPPQDLDEAVATDKESDGVLIGPDLNASRSQLDKKLYRQILLPNGLRALLVSDVLAIHQMRNAGISNVGYEDDDEEDVDDDEEESEKDDDDDRKDGLDGDSDDESDDDDDDQGLRNAAAAVIVGVGSMYDPPECQGLAHFLEHLLFMGSAKYPTENAFDSFLSKHGGSDNAYTELEHTVYHLEIPQEHLFESLDMLAQFFIHPLLLEDAVERELNSIESEFQLSKNSDECRLQQLMCHTCGYDATTHPFAKFGWGNLKSLRDVPASNNVNVMDMLRSFYNQYYYAENTRVVVMGAYSLDELQKRVVQHFSDVPAQPREVALYPVTRTLASTWNVKYESFMQTVGLPFHESSLGKIYKMIPVRDRHTLSVTWQVPPQWKNWKSKPCDFLAHLIGHEAEGSLLSRLKDLSWASGCYAGVGNEGYEFSSAHALFVVTFTLSSEGVDNWENVVGELYKYIGMLLHYHLGFPSWIHEELRAIHDLSYRFKDEESPDDFVQELAEKLVPQSLIDPEHLLDGDARLFEHDAHTVLELLETYLKPRKSRLDLISSHFGRASDYNDDVVSPSSADGAKEHSSDLRTEPMFGTKYRCESLADDLVSKWEDLARPTIPDESGLHLPHPNPFIPTAFDLKPLPPDDAHHPLLHASLKLCISVGKKKSWFPATVTKFNSITNEILLSYEDEDAKWHKMDQAVSELHDVQPDNEGTLDDRQVKYRVIALPLEGEGAVLKFGDESDFHAQDGTGFPPLPPELPESRLPKLVVDTQALKLWHLQDRKFHRPIAELRLRFVCAEANKTPLHRTCADMFVRLCHDAVQETSYLASVCELSSEIDSSDTGFSLRVHGFDHKLLDLFDVVLKVLMSFRGIEDGATSLPKTIKPGRFEPSREVLKRGYGNCGMKSSALCSDVRVRCLRSQMWSPHQKLVVLNDLDVSTFLQTMSSILDKMCVEALFHGNVSLEDAEKASILVTEALGNHGGGLPKKKYPAQLVTKLPLSLDNRIIVLPGKDPQESNTAVEMYLQVGKDDITERVIIDLLSHIMYEPFYDIVRTKSQFGYHVSCDSRFTDGVMGMHFQIVTNTKSASDATEQIDRFLTDYRSELDRMSQEDFLEHLVGLVKHKLDMFNSLSEETDSLWGEICDGRYDWQIHRNEAVCLRNVTKQKVLAAYDKWLLPGKKRRMVVVQVIGSGDGAVSLGRPVIEHGSSLEEYADHLVEDFHKFTKGQTWGKIYI